jgi:hypothetical protein
MMLGHIMEWFYSGLVGIRQAENSVGFRKLVIAPNPVGDVSWAKARYRSPDGDIICSWRLEGSALTLELEIPAGAEATVLLPAAPSSPIIESGRPITERKEIKPLGREGNRVALGIGSGKYRFESGR